MIAAMERQSLIGAARALDFWKSEAWPSYPDPLTARCCWRARSLPAFAPAALKPHLARLPLEEAALDGVVNAMMKCAPHLMGMRWWPITHTHTQAQQYAVGWRARALNCAPLPEGCPHPLSQGQTRRDWGQSEPYPGFLLVAHSLKLEQNRVERHKAAGCPLPSHSLILAKPFYSLLFWRAIPLVCMHRALTILTYHTWQPSS